MGISRERPQAAIPACDEEKENLPKCERVGPIAEARRRAEEREIVADKKRQTSQAFTSGSWKSVRRTNIFASPTPEIYLSANRPARHAPLRPQAELPG